MTEQPVKTVHDFCAMMHVWDATVQLSGQLKISEPVSYVEVQIPSH